MATITSSQNPTLLDLAKMTAPNGDIQEVIEILSETNEILKDMTFTEGNLPTGHRTTARKSLPSGTWRSFYDGVQPTKSRTEQVTETCAMLEAYAECDAALAGLAKNLAAFRMNEERAHIEGINQQMANALFYSDESVNPKQFTGFTPRFNSLTGTNAENIIDAGGTGSDNRSIWLVVWGPQTVMGIVPMNSTAGLQRTDKGLVTIEDADGNGGRMEAYRTHYRFDIGLCVKDWRYVVRICNIDKSALSHIYKDGQYGVNPGDSANLPNLIHQAYRQIPTMGMGRAALYMSRDILTSLQQQVSSGVSQSTLMAKDVGGMLQTEFLGIPIRRCDALATDEARTV